MNCSLHVGFLPDLCGVVDGIVDLWHQQGHPKNYCSLGFRQKRPCFQVHLNRLFFSIELQAYLTKWPVNYFIFFYSFSIFGHITKSKRASKSMSWVLLLSGVISIHFRCLWSALTRSWSCPSYTLQPQEETLMSCSELLTLCSWLHRRRLPHRLTGRYVVKASVSKRGDQQRTRTDVTPLAQLLSSSS